MTLQFEELNEVDMRSLWPHEAHDFTPWLANHLEHLSQTVGIPMELEGTEVSVGPFSADILARDPSDNRILIENQLEYTDHTHLGQALTYLAGLEAQTVIWIARGFQNPHLSAIRWLNEHTTDPFAFFAVQVKVLRIGQDSSSPMSLRFEVLEKPNEWDREVRARRAGSDRSAVHDLYHDFWVHYGELYPADISWRTGRRHSNVYHPIEGLLVSQYLATSAGGVGIYIAEFVRKGSPLDDETAQLAERSKAILETSGVESSWQCDLQDRTNWQGIADWFHGQLGVYREVIEAEAARIPEPSTPET